MIQFWPNAYILSYGNSTSEMSFPGTKFPVITNCLQTSSDGEWVWSVNPTVVYKILFLGWRYNMVIFTRLSFTDCPRRGQIFWLILSQTIAAPTLRLNSAWITESDHKKWGSNRPMNNLRFSEKCKFQKVHSSHN